VSCRSRPRTLDWCRRTSSPNACWSSSARTRAMRPASVSSTAADY